MKSIVIAATLSVSAAALLRADDLSPAPQAFRQEVAVKFPAAGDAPGRAFSLVVVAPAGGLRAFSGGTWFEVKGDRLQPVPALAQSGEAAFVFPRADGAPAKAPLPWREARQILFSGAETYVAGVHAAFRVDPQGAATSLEWSAGETLNQLAVGPGGICAAAAGGLFVRQGSAWQRVEVPDGQGRIWAARDVLGVAYDSQGRLWFAVKAGVGCRTPGGWRFFEGRDGLPWNDFTGIAAGPGDEVWFTTHLGVVRYDGHAWQYRQGERWLPGDNVAQGVVDAAGRAWFATDRGVGTIERRAMTLAEKAQHYEAEIEHYVKRTPYGYVSQAQLRKAADRSSADPQDDDNDGLWTSMYGAGESFAYAATKDPKAKERARKAFEALRFLQKVTQGSDHEPPKGYVARSIRPVDGPNPNDGRPAADREAHEKDSLWKLYEPRWPKSADGRWYWKSDTSSDELDGHFFFYPIYFDLCADTDAERDRVREVVRDLTDHLVSHGYRMVDADGKPTRWGMYAPEELGHDPLWWQERGLKSLSMLAYLAGAEHVTGDAKYGRLARELIDRHAYAHNAMQPKVQQGPGSGNQSDDEMAFMCYYNLLRLSHDEDLKRLMRYSLFHYWVNEAPEMNPFFNFVIAAENNGTVFPSPFGPVALSPWAGWQEDAMATLYGFPLDRLSWGLQNRHRIDLQFLASVASEDVDGPDEPHTRGYLLNGKVLPVENRYFGHWNTDPWKLDYPGHGEELGAGTVFLLPYYMGLYHGYIQKP